MSGLDWEKARRRDQLKRAGAPPRPPSQRPKGPTNEQRAYLKRLAQRAGEQTPMPRTRRDASAEINRLKRKLETRRPSPVPAAPRRDARKFSPARTNRDWLSPSEYQIVHEAESKMA